MQNPVHPLLFVPFVAWAAIHISASLTVTWGRVRATTNGYDLLIEGPQDDLSAARSSALNVSIAEGHVAMVAPAMRGAVSDRAWANLNTFAQRTYAPATEASRIFGAGAGTTDND